MPPPTGPCIFPLPPPLPLTALFLTLGIVIPGTTALFLIIRHGTGSKKALSSTVIFSIVAIAFGVFFVSSYQVEVQTCGSELTVRCPPYADKVIRQEDIVTAFVVDWNTNSSFKPITRTSGTAFGNYRVGWFKLENGYPALLITSSSNNLCILTKEGYYLMLHIEPFAELVAQTLRMHDTQS